ncbi:MAG: relaxase/mobilization nuclease domain-containing protein [Bradyrhizobium sp.]|nr:relaxase/mobilization nuclease domain-containing protein [Bradyrhizobium sp.]
MVPRFAKAGRSFTGVAKYLLHDMGHAATSERVAWTHTLNCVHDNVPAAIQEMIGTWRNADLLKQEAGIPASGRKMEKPVKHISLNWHPSEQPDREAMIAAAEGFLKAMGYQRQQAVLIAHTDRAHRHVHIVMSTVDPETGRKIDDRYEFRRAQNWAAAYEQERGRVFCAERLKPVAEREASPHRAVWQLLEESVAAHRHAEAARFAGAMPQMEAAHAEALDLEWQVLKQLQREEREAFFVEGRAVYGAARTGVYRVVRKELRPEWRDLYKSARAGADRMGLHQAKEDLIARQSDILREGIDLACGELRKERDAAYREMLDRQKEARADLRERQAENVPADKQLAAMAQEQARRLGPTWAQLYAERTRERKEPGPGLPAEKAPRWTERGSMAAQQGSAVRWINRAAARAKYAPTPEPDTKGIPSRARPFGGLRTQGRNGEDRSAGKDEKGLEPGPD